MDYKKYSLENLENWLHDAVLSSEASPQEIYDVIKGAVDENYHYFKHHTGLCYELLSLLNGNGKGHIEAYDEYVKEVQSEKEYYEGKDDGMRPWGHSDIEYQIANQSKTSSCDKDDTSPECQGAWNDFWEQSYLSGVTDTPEEANELRDEIEVIRQQGGYDWTPSIGSVDKVKKWVLPVEVDASGECFVTFPDDLLEVADLKEGDQVEWFENNGNGSYTLKKVTKKPLKYDEAIKEGWKMTDDGFWIKEN